MKSPVKSLITLLLLVSAGMASADVQRVQGAVLRTLIQESAYGGCMALLDVSIREATGLDCDDGWVTFSCTGDYQAKDFAWKMFESVQMAAVLNKRVTVYVDDSKKHNGFCAVERVDLIY